MSRETKAEREAREATARKISQEKYARDYPERLMEALYRASEHGLLITATTDHQFRIEDPKNRDGICLSYSIGPMDHYCPIYELENELDMRDAIKAKEAREKKILDDVMIKLSHEEKQVLRNYYQGQI